MFFRKSFLERMLMEEAGKEGGAGGSGEAGGEGDKNKGGEAGSGTGGGEGGEGGQGSGNDFDLSKQPKEVQDLVKSLRAENAKYRTGNKSLAERLDKFEKGFKSIFGDEDQEEAPEVKVQKLTETAQSLEIKNAMLELAVEHGIGKDQREYFEFLMAKALDSLADDEELSEEAFESILGKVQANGKSGGPANSSVDDKKQGDKKPEGKDGALTAEQFAKMTIMQKSELYQTKPDVYNALVAEAKEKKLM